MNIDISYDGGANYNTIGPSAENTGSWNWSVPGIPTTSCKVKVTSVQYPSISDESNGVFAIASPPQTFTISGYVRTSGGSGIYDVRMNGLPDAPRTDGSGHYSVQVNKGWTGTVTPTKMGYTFVPASTSYSSVSSNITQDYTGTAPPPRIIVTYPNGGETLIQGQPITVTWDNVGDTGVQVNIEYTPNNGATWFYSGYLVNNTGSWTGYLTGGGPAYKIRVTSAQYPSVSDESDGIFTIITEWYISGYVRTAEGDEVGGVSMVGMAGPPVTDSTGYYSGPVDVGWTGTVTPQKQGCIFTPASKSYTSVDGDLTDEDYVVAEPGYTVTSPNGGEVWIIGQKPSVTWTTSGNPGDKVNIYQSLDGGDSYTQIATEVDNNGSWGTGATVWTPDGVESTTCRIKVASALYPSWWWDASDADFAILRAPIVGAGNKAVLDTIMQSAAPNYNWVLWGKVTIIDSSKFSIDDGSGVDIEVLAPGYDFLGVGNGSYVTVRGTLDLSNPLSPKLISREVTKRN